MEAGDDSDGEDEERDESKPNDSEEENADLSCEGGEYGVDWW